MAGAKLTLILSGFIQAPGSEGLLPFWNGFIDIQKCLPNQLPLEQIVAHSWNSEFSSLVKSVYGPNDLAIEQQNCSFPQLACSVEAPTQIEVQSEKLSEIWDPISASRLLANAYSRSKAVQLAQELETGYGQALLTNWDIGQGNAVTRQRPILDAALPTEYLYLSSSADVDEGYCDNWAVMPLGLVEHFTDFADFVMASLVKENSYLEKFSRTGWPRAQRQSIYANLLKHPLAQGIHAGISCAVHEVLTRAQGTAFFSRVIRRLLTPLNRFLQRPTITAENSCIETSKQSKLIFPLSKALNGNSILKYFLLSKGLRQKTRFLTCSDFSSASQTGQLINPAALVLIVEDADDSEISTLLAESPLPLSSVYQLQKHRVIEHRFSDQSGWTISVLDATSKDPIDKLTVALNAITNASADFQPILLLPSVKQYLACSDWFYLNALLKYVAWSRSNFVSLDGMGKEQIFKDFPDLYTADETATFRCFNLIATAAPMLELVRELHNSESEHQNIGRKFFTISRRVPLFCDLSGHKK
ncbi:MAG: hypothetical protein HWE23_02385 [Rhodobacteraceae bacterium]|nr:hypothetical protein [Paracoccaceae bacterium]